VRTHTFKPFGIYRIVLAVTAVAQAEAVIADVFGKEYVLEGGRKFKSRKGAQGYMNVLYHKVP
jgi:hypothetical protein